MSIRAGSCCLMFNPANQKSHIAWLTDRGLLYETNHEHECRGSPPDSPALAADSGEVRMLGPSPPSYSSAQPPTLRAPQLTEPKTTHQSPTTKPTNPKANMSANTTSVTTANAAATSSGEGRTYNDWPVEMDPLSTVILGKL